MTPPRLLVDDGQDDRAIRRARRIASAERLRVVVVMAEDPDRTWTEAELALRTGYAAGDLRSAAEILVRRGLFLRDTAGIRLSDEPETRARVEALARVFRESPDTLLRVLNVDAIERVRIAAGRLSDPPGTIRRLE